MTHAAQQERPSLAPMAELDPIEDPSDERFDRVVRLAQQFFGVPMAAVNLLDPVHMETIAAVGLPRGECPREGTFCERTVDTARTFVVPDAATDDRFSHQPHVTGDPHIRFYAGEPLFAPGGQAVGTLCIFDDKPRDISPLETRMLRDLADWVEKELAYDADGAQAREVQRRLLPRREVVVPGYEVAGQCRPARNVGGDYFDWQELPDGTIQVVVADVMGKGLKAAVVAAGVRSVIRGASRFNHLAQSIGRVGQDMEEDLTDTSTFVTLFAARLTPETGAVEYVDAGHGLALVIQAEGTVRRLASKDLPLGTLPGDTWTSHHDRLDPGDTLLVVSDGILDLFLDTWSAVRAAVSLSKDVRDAREMVEAITSIGGSGTLDDDITAVVIRRQAS